MPASPPAGVSAEGEVERRFQEAMTTAKADPTLQQLKAKSDNALTEAEGRKAGAAYTRALFQRIREIDSTVAEYASGVEDAILRRIGND